MIRAAIARAAGVAHLAAALLLTTLAIRFSVTAVLRGVAERTPKLSPSGEAPLVPSGVPVSSGPPLEPAGPTAVAGASLRVPLVVSGGAPRSEVYVNGIKVGQSPYLGEVSCKAGELVKIEVLPPSGSPAAHMRRCAPGTLKVSD